MRRSLRARAPVVRRVGLALAAAAMCWPACASAGIVPGSGQLISTTTKVSGECQLPTPPMPQSNGFADPSQDWGPEHDGTPYRATETYSSFTDITTGPAVPDPDAPTFGPGYDLASRGFRCMFADGSTETSLGPGVYLMHVVDERYDETFDSVTGWVPQPDNNATQTVEDVRFEVTTKNPCDSPWAGIGPTAPVCLKQKQKREARAEMQHSLHVIRSNNWRTGPGSFERGQLNKAAWGAIGSWQQKVADDPPVKSFTKVASRGRARLRWMPPPSRLSGPERRIAAYLERAGGAVAAMVASINRANGAFAATLKNPSADRWTARQNTAADEDALAAYSDLNSALSVDDTTPTLGAGLHSAIGRFARLMNTIG